MSSPQSYGQALPDQVDRIARLSDAQLGLLSDVREMYKERALLEKEYAGKLQVLAKKAADRKSKRMASLVVGDDPAKACNEDTVRSSTLDMAYTQLIAGMDHAVQDHINFSDALTTQIVDAVKTLERKHEETKKKQMQFYQKVLTDRDRVYVDRLKMKQKYDEECSEVESYRQKQGRAHDDRHAARAAKQFEQQQVDMNNGKNSYLIATAIANKSKDKFYEATLPTLENQFQSVQKNTVLRLISLLQSAQAIRSAQLTTLQSRVSVVQEALGHVDVMKDQDLFIEYNARAFTIPNDWTFEPCQGYYDTGELNVEPAPKVFLQNKLIRCRTKLAELGPLLEAKKKESNQLEKLVAAYTIDHKLGSVDDVTDNLIESQHQYTLLAAAACAVTAEVDTIVAALGDDEGAQQPHTFKSASFSIPTTCGYCKASIWGLSKQGKTCKSCGLSVHSKCELKVPAECSSSHPGKTQPMISSLSRVGSGSRPSTSVMSSLAKPRHSVDEHHPVARIVYEFTPTSPFELAVQEGEKVQILEGDDGSGWVKVADSRGGRGLVPASYVESCDEDDVGAVAVPPARAAPAVKATLGSGEYVRALYTYQASGADELDLQEGAVIELSAGSMGGKDYADGWWEGYNNEGKKGIFPSNYVEPV